MPIYVVFEGVDYYPAGGAWDVSYTFEAESDREAKAHVKGELPEGGTTDWLHVARLIPEELGSEVIANWGRGYYGDSPRESHMKPWERVTVYD